MGWSYEKVFKRKPKSYIIFSSWLSNRNNTSADSILNSSIALIDNSNMGLTKNGQVVTNVQDAIEAIYTTANAKGYVSERCVTPT